MRKEKRQLSLALAASRLEGSGEGTLGPINVGVDIWVNRIILQPSACTTFSRVQRHPSVISFHAYCEPLRRPMPARERRAGAANPTEAPSKPKPACLFGASSQLTTAPEADIPHFMTGKCGETSFRRAKRF